MSPPWLVCFMQRKKINGSSCFTIPIEESVLRKFNQDMYDFKSQARADSDSD